MVVHFLIEFLTCENNLISIDDDNVVTAVSVGSEGGLMLTSEKLSSFSSYVTEVLTFSVDNLPLTGDVACFGHIS